MLTKLTFREIRKSIGRYIAILAITALGVGFFAGLRVSKTAMVQTADVYLRDLNFYDYQLISTLGYTEENAEALRRIDGVSHVEGSMSTDALFAREEGSDFVLKVHSLTQEINRLDLVAGRLPENPNECVVDADLFPASEIGTLIYVADSNTDETRDHFLHDAYEIVGVANSPYYLNYERGTTSLGSGSVMAFVYIPESGMDFACYTELFVTLEERAEIYTAEYDAIVEAMEPVITEAAEAEADRRYTDLIGDAEIELSDAEQELADARTEYADAKAEAEQELQDAYDELRAAEEELADGRNELLVQTEELDAAKAELDENAAKLATAKVEFDAQKAEAIGYFDQLESELNVQFRVIDASLEQIAGLGQAEEEARLLAARAALEEQWTQVMQARTAAEAELGAAEAELQAQQAALDGYAAQLEEGYDLIDAGWTTFYAAEEELADGWQEYNDGRAEADAEFADAEREIEDAQMKIDDARAELDDVTSPTVYVLDRAANIGYVCFSNDTDIVSGVANVFPLFFFLVAALVCITTMTRMVDEQRTQIGVLKALGYSQRAIMAKYMIYSCSATLIGGVLGFFGGSVLFPKVFWAVYSIMYGFSSVRFIFDVPLFVGCMLAYLACAVGATLFSCHAELTNVAAELIRPKSPKAGKRVFLERVPIIWNRLGFLQKVSIRNIVRYKRRLVMMVIGIGGCTALVATGLGVRDSIKDVVNYQYDTITTYDMTVSFDDGKSGFTEECADVIGSALLVHESTSDISAGDKVKPANIVVSDRDVAGFVDLHAGDQHIEWPGLGAAVLNDKLAATLNVGIGDTISLRDDALQTMELTVSGIFDNYVFNYVFFSAETSMEQWGYVPECNTAYIYGAEDMDIHETAADIMTADGVLTVTVGEDFRERINSMLSSLDYIVLLIIVCAAALAFIVLYNLTNINITERIREIATLKVLGFRGRESAAYVFSENMALTVLGALVGLGLGKLLHAFVMSKINIDLISFDVRITPLSYVLSVLLTIVFALLVDFVLYFKLERINMAESLKSIE